MVIEVLIVGVELAILVNTVIFSNISVMDVFSTEL